MNERGKYKLNQTLDYDSLSYSSSLDYPIEIEGETLYPGQSYEKYLERKNGKHARADWAWRWSKDKFDWGYKNDFVVLKKNGGLDHMINWEGKDQNLLALIKYIANEDKLEKVLENPQVIKTPVVRNGKQSTLGYQPDVWKKWN